MGAETPWYESQVVGVMVGFVAGIISSLFVNWWWNRHLRPDLSIETKVVVSYFHLKDSNDKPIKYHSNRVKVVNNGRTSARECKAFLLSDNRMERVAWLIPYKDAGYTNNLNAHDKEYVDVCAVVDVGNNRIATTERGYGKKVSDARPLSLDTRRRILRISAANATPREAELLFTSEVRDDHILIEVQSIQKPSTATNIKKWIRNRVLKVNSVDQHQGST